jgi:hypothetical protein
MRPGACRLKSSIRRSIAGLADHKLRARFADLGGTEVSAWGRIRWRRRKAHVRIRSESQALVIVAAGAGAFVVATYALNPF